MPYYCTVPRCTSMAGKTRDVSFHQFPRDAALAERWNLILRRGKPYTKYSKVCSRHFTPVDYTMTNVGKNKGHWRTLRKDAVPSQNLPSESPPPTPYRTRIPRPDADNITEQQVQQQLAHAVYVQTMLAVHAASRAAARSPLDGRTLPAAADALGPNAEEDNAPSDESDTEEASWHTAEDIGDHFINRTGRYSADTTTDVGHPTQEPEHPHTSFKCVQCSKCFKDPDVFLLHKRWHSSQPQNANCSNNNLELLAQILQPFGADFNQISSPSRLQLDNQVLAAMRSNMESYIKGIMSASIQSYENAQNEGMSEDKNDENDLNESVGSGQLVIDENVAG